MARLTITLSEARHRALKEAAARTGKTIGELIEASLDEYGIRSGPTAEELVSMARARSKLSAAEAMELASRETRAARER